NESLIGPTSRWLSRGEEFQKNVKIHPEPMSGLYDQLLDLQRSLVLVVGVVSGGDSE
ncbi:hypothetical protein HAX54_029859, partial [Datura stramonium]|nr:hypothetical protein [Datura stramonium]